MKKNSNKKQIFLSFKNVSKTFGSVKAVDNISLDIYKGEILAILGENGSGKTSLMNILTGIYFPDKGSILINNKPVQIHSPKEAYKHKIGMVYQHFKLVNVFSGIDNVLLGIKKEPFILKKDRGAEIKKLCDKYGFNVDLNKQINDMSVSEKQTVEIIKVLYRGVDLLILDEPTAVLTPQEIKKFFAVLKKMRDDGKTIIIITHKLNEVMEISDRVAILRKGQYIKTVRTKTTNEKELTDLMVGHKIDLKINRTTPIDPHDRLIINGLTLTNSDKKKVLNKVTFTARSNEILGIAGIAGSGQKELLEILSGIRDYDEGSIIYHHPKKNMPVTLFHKSVKVIKQMVKENKFHDYITHRPVTFKGMSNKQIIQEIDDGHLIFNDDEIIDLKGMSPLDMKLYGIRSSFVPEDRLGMGLVGNMDIVDNMMLRNYRKGKIGFLNKSIPTELSLKIIKDLDVVTPSIHTQIGKLSGGNIQKLLVGREISSSPYVLTCAYPVRGLDINSSYTIYNLLNREKVRGTAIIFVGEDLDVMLALCDRIAVICDGEITGIVDARKTSKETIGLMMTNSLKQEKGVNYGK